MMGGMPVLAPVLLVAVLAFGAYSIGATTPLVDIVDIHGQAAQAGATAAAPSGNAGTSNSESFDDQVANKQCPKPTVKNGAQEVYRKDKMLDSPFQEGGRNYYNLYGTPCEGPMVRAFCSNENYCDAKVFGNSECKIEGKWQKCKTPAGAQYASIENGTACPGCTSAPDDRLANLGNEPPPPPQSTSPANGSQQINQAYQPSSPQPTSPSSPGAARPTPVQQLENVTPAQQQTMTNPVDRYTNPGGQRFEPGPIQNTGSAIQPTSPAPTGSTFQPGQTRPNFPSGQQNTFQNPQRNSFFQNRSNPFNRPTTPFGNTGAGADTRRTGFSNLFANGFSASGLLNSFTNLIGNIIAPPKQQTVVQNTIVQIVQPATQQNSERVIPPTSSVRVPQETSAPLETVSVPEIRLPQGSRAIIAVPRTVGGEIDIAKLQQLADEYGTSSAPTILIDDVAAPTAAPIIPTPDLIGPASTSSSLSEVRQSFAETVAIARGMQDAPAMFRPVPSDARSAEEVEFFHAVSIPKLLDAISDGSARFVRWVFGQDAPRSAGTGAQTLEEFVGEARPALPSEGGSVAPGSSGPTGPAQGAQQPTVDRAAPTRADRLAPGLDASFRDVSPAHSGPIPRALPENIYPDVLPVPVRESGASSGPSFLQLVIENGAKELRALFLTLWNFVVPR